MVHPSHRAGRTLHGLTAVTALEHRGIPLAVEKQESLLASSHTGCDCLSERRAQNGAEGRVTQVHHRHRRRLDVGRAERQDLQADCVHGVQRRMRGGQHEHGPGSPGAFVGHGPRIVPGRVFRLVGGMVFLVDDDEAQMGEGGKDG